MSVVRYAILQRRKGSRRAYSDGYTDDLEYLYRIAQQRAESGEYSMVKIINADTDSDMAYFTKATR